MVEFLDYARQRKAILYYDPNFRKAHAHEAIHLAPTLLENFEYADIIRGSDEDFLNIFGEADSEKVYTDHIRFYCDRFITTHGAGGVNLYHGDLLALHPPGQYDRSRRQLQCWHPLRSVKK